MNGFLTPSRMAQPVVRTNQVDSTENMRILLGRKKYNVAIYLKDGNDKNGYSPSSRDHTHRFPPARPC